MAKAKLRSTRRLGSTASADAQKHYDLGMAYVEQGPPIAALVQLEMALRLDPLHERAQQAITMIEKLRRQLDLPPPPTKA